MAQSRPCAGHWRRAAPSPTGGAQSWHALSIFSRIFSYKGCTFSYKGTRTALARAIKPPVTHLGLFVCLQRGFRVALSGDAAPCRRVAQRGETRARLSAFPTHRCSASSCKTLLLGTTTQRRSVRLSEPFGGSYLDAGMMHFEQYQLPHPSSLVSF